MIKSDYALFVSLFKKPCPLWTTGTKISVHGQINIVGILGQNVSIGPLLNPPGCGYLFFTQS